MAETPIDKCFGRALTMDFKHYKDTDLVSVDEIKSWEEANTPILQDDIVLFRFGWDRYWAPRSVDRTYTHSWPGISGEAAQYLVSMQVKPVGCDTLAIDSSYSADCPAHYALLGNSILIIENLTRLEQIIGESFFPGPHDRQVRSCSSVGCPINLIYNYSHTIQ
jgi:kynurenine formamidase